MRYLALAFALAGLACSTDAVGPVGEDAAAARDAIALAPDATTPRDASNASDAAAMTDPDAAQSHPDAAPLSPDASTSPEDAGTSAPDATALEPDADAPDATDDRDAHSADDAELPADDAGADASLTPDADAPDASPGSDAGADTDAGGAPTCLWIDVTQCDSGEPIAVFCPAGRHVAQMRRCNQTFYVPDSSYQMYLLSRCPDSTCPINPTHVVWSGVECCL